MADNEQRILIPKAAEGRITRRLLLAGALGVGATAALAACSSGSGGSGGSTKGGTINLYTWGEYDDPAVLKSYTTKTGTKISVDTFNSNEEMIAKLVAANGTTGYDLVVPTDRFVPQMAKKGLLEKLDHAQIPNLKNIEAEFASPDYDPDNVYSAVKAWGTSGYVYDTTVIKRELKTWEDFWDAASKEAKGKTTLLDDPGEIGGMYFIMKGQDVNTTDATLLKQYQDFILSKADTIQAFESYPSDKIAQNQFALSHAWNGDARKGLQDNKTKGRYKWVLPKEGTLKFVDNWCVVKGGDAKEQSFAFINWVLDPAVSLRELQYIGYGTGVKGVSDKAKSAGLDFSDMIFLPASHKMIGKDINNTEQLVAIYNKLKAAAS